MWEGAVLKPALRGITTLWWATCPRLSSRSKEESSNVSWQRPQCQSSRASTSRPPGHADSGRGDKAITAAPNTKKHSWLKVNEITYRKRGEMIKDKETHRSAEITQASQAAIREPSQTLCNPTESFHIRKHKHELAIGHERKTDFKDWFLICVLLNFKG